MKTYKIPVSWTVTAMMEVEAESLESAVDIADSMPLPTDTEYVDGSFTVDYQCVHFGNQLSEDDVNFVKEQEEENC